MDDTPSKSPTSERVWERVGPPRKLIKEIKTRFGVEVSSSTVSNWRSSNNKKNNAPNQYYPLIAAMSEYSLEEVFYAFNPESRITETLDRGTH
ncbi:hypothetical protein GCM10007094_23450 [Pseudovibrio japonicus]|uniref:XRE family transcriptional regulator n=1 Tax=Pseudovibrio japonicus TaxID=366534 RepID=A0ABQ3ECT7_9HYPH|nr:hypothetical protein [Pseudovibrio japonicus]GHB33860.1 hypothetical protein GCM10007094_23450 [Pseudovibrio japonicus]